MLNANFDHISRFLSRVLLLTLNKQMFVGIALMDFEPLHSTSMTF